MADPAALDAEGGPRHHARRATPLDEIAAAVSFLTRLPTSARSGAKRTGASARTGAAAFGLVGLGLGIVAALPVVVAPDHPLIAAVGVLAVLAVLDGAFHLDGLADSADALAAASPAAVERARTDPRIGSAGAVALVLVLGLQVAAIAELAGRADPLVAAAAIVAAVVTSRTIVPLWALLVGASMAPREGLAGWFSANVSTAAAIVSLLTLVVVEIVLVEWVGLRTLLTLALGLAVATLLGAIVVRLRRQLDGDGFGAIIELTVTAVLVAAALIG